MRNRRTVVGAPLPYSNPADPLEIGRRPGHLIWRAQQHCWRLFMEEAGDCDITPVQASILLIIGDRAGIDQKTVAALIALDKATTGNVVARLEARGLLTRATPPSDRRVRALFLTAAGKALNRRLGSVTRRARERLVKDLTAREQRELIRLLRKILGLTDATKAHARGGGTRRARPARRLR
jgi:DNA-binding MarR family transcriptional regulator